MYHYYQIEEKEAWTPVREKDLEKTLKEVEGIRKVSILAVSDMVDPDNALKDSKGYSYKGPLYFDIDCSSDLKLAIESGKTLCEKLVDAGVPEAALKVYASGSKGIHITLDQLYFSSGRPCRNLAKIYREMARELYVPGLDYQVYSGGKGNSWRLPNARRDDGNYKVPILVSELSSLDEEGYRELCKSPRFNVVPLEPKPFKVMELEALFEAARKVVNSKPLPVIEATAPELAVIKDNVPACVQQMADYKDILGDKNFNEVAMQMGVYIARSGTSKTIADGLISRLADNGSSSKYSTLREKLNHVKGQVAYMKNRKGYGFSCGSMRSLLARPPCSGCPLENTQAGAHQASQSGGIIEQDCQFFLRGNQQDKLITNFTLVATDVFIDVPQAGGRLRRVGIKVDLRYQDEVHASLVMNESSWASRANFIRTLEGQAARVPEIFYGSDAEVQKIKHYVMSREPDMGEIYQVWTCGIHMDIVSNTEVFTYVEPGLSINSNKISGTHELAGKMIARPYFGTTTLPTAGDEMTDEVMYNLLNINNHTELAQIVGWFVACHLKTHLTALYSQFPLLGLWGNAGSGKSAQSGLVSWLNGTDYSVRDTGVNVSNITPYAVIEYCASTTTVPRLVEEFNVSKMRSSSYKQVGETLKAAWNGETVLRGGLGKRHDAGRTGAIVNEIPITSPLVVISEQQIEAPALQERSLRVKLSKDIRSGRTQHFEKANRGRQQIRQVGKALMIRALKTTLDEVEQQMLEVDSLLSRDIDDRPRYCFQTAMVGLKFLRKVLHENLRLPKSTEACDALIEALETKFKWLTSHVSLANARSEVDGVLDSLNVMMGMTMAGPEVWLKEGVHVVRGKDDVLFLDIVLAHANYNKYAMHHLRTEDRVLTGSVTNFSTLLKDEAYYGGVEFVEGIGQSKRTYTKLYLDKMEMKGINVAYFRSL